jgi:tripartite-type tricarboxylate transporter receptor subunit TctC
MENKRSPVPSDLLTLAEAGTKDAKVYSWQGLAGPRGLPAPVKAKIADAANAAMRDPMVQQ